MCDLPPTATVQLLYVSDNREWYVQLPFSLVLSLCRGVGGFAFALPYSITELSESGDRPSNA